MAVNLLVDMLYAVYQSAHPGAVMSAKHSRHRPPASRFAAAARVLVLFLRQRGALLGLFFVLLLLSRSSRR
jgi:hypothetical protein